MIQVRNLSVKYRGGADFVVRDASFTVEVGAPAVIQGPSGCGKTTLIRAVAGLQWLDRSMEVTGQVLVDGSDVSKVPAGKRNFGLMFQQPYLFENLNVGQNVAYGLYRRPKSVQQQAVERLLTLVHLPGYANRDVRTLSGGEAQRVALARTLAVEPQLIMFDEPFNSLDDNIRFQLIDDVLELLLSNATAGIFVTHNQDEVRKLGGKLIKWQPNSIPSFA